MTPPVDCDDVGGVRVLASHLCKSFARTEITVAVYSKKREGWSSDRDFSDSTRYVLIGTREEGIIVVVLRSRVIRLY